jgi:nitrite reductase/ring-hydroxylating ferredoxin subunit
MHEVCEASEVPKGTCKAFQIDGRGVALYNVDGVFYATQDFCRHKGGSLGKGELKGSIVACPLHGWRFNVITGDCLTQPHCKKLRLFPTFVEGGRIMVEI